MLHAGVYYAPGSLKARLCRAGSAELREFCAQRGIALDPCGKLIVASAERELGRLEALAERAVLNGLAPERLDRAALARREPRVRGVVALWIAQTAVVDYRGVCAALAREFQAAGGELLLSRAVTSIRERAGGVTIGTSGGDLDAGVLLGCAGLQADRLARLAGLAPDFRIVPFRGEFHRLSPRFDGALSALVYPVPDPALPFLGVHLTRTLDGGLIAGPNAVPALAREAYARDGFDWRDLAETASWPGSWRFAWRNARHGARELRNSLWRDGYLAEVRRYLPAVTREDLLPHPCGIRAQALDRDGRMIDDFLFLESARTLHVCNAPSPAATSCLPIGAELAGRVLAKLG